MNLGSEIWQTFTGSQLGQYLGTIKLRHLLVKHKSLNQSYLNSGLAAA